MHMAKTIWFAGVAAAAIGFSVAANADVKAGVDAWTDGNFANAVREWAGPAEQGDPDAQFNMAQAYRLGRGVDQDVVQAEALYAKAAAQGHVRAADNYGLLLFQRGAREEAMPYVTAAARRGDPRAQYLLGIAHFNGDLAEKDWRRAYALLTLANSTGLPQARAAIAQMDEYISLEERQEAQSLASTLKAEAEAARARELAAVDLALGTDNPSVASTPSRPTKPGADYTSGVAACKCTGAIQRCAFSWSSGGIGQYNCPRCCWTSIGYARFGKAAGRTMEGAIGCLRCAWKCRATVGKTLWPSGNQGPIPSAGQIRQTYGPVGWRISIPKRGRGSL